MIFFSVPPRKEYAKAEEKIVEEWITQEPMVMDPLMPQEPTIE